ncbi:hypothetical protein A2U01_0003693, partial [Trifolium medium]|nr:hypothetical protein [Trifolium medium]
MKENRWFCIFIGIDPVQARPPQHTHLKPLISIKRPEASLSKVSSRPSDLSDGRDHSLLFCLAASAHGPWIGPLPFLYAIHTPPAYFLHP